MTTTSIRKVKVLSEMIKHHVKEEEQRGGMFAEARKSDMDLDALGEQMAAAQDRAGKRSDGRRKVVPAGARPHGPPTLIG